MSIIPINSLNEMRSFNIKLPKDYSLLFLSPINRFDLPFLSITGIVDCDMYTGTVHFPFFIKNSFTGIIEKGTPIVQIIPISLLLVLLIPILIIMPSMVILTTSKYIIQQSPLPQWSP